MKINEIRERLGKATREDWDRKDATIFFHNAPDDIRFLLGEVERLEKRIANLEKIEKHYWVIMDESIEVAEGRKPHAD